MCIGLLIDIISKHEKDAKAMHSREKRTKLNFVYYDNSTDVTSIFVNGTDGATLDNLSIAKVMRLFIDKKNIGHEFRYFFRF